MYAALLLLGVLWSSLALSGELRLYPPNPERGSSVSVEYRPDSLRFAPGEYLWLYVYEFTEHQAYPTLREIPLEYQRTTGVHVGAFRLDTATVFALCKVGTGHLFDTHHGQLWEILVHERGKPLRAALIRAATSRFGLIHDGGWRRMPDLETAERLLQQVVREYPNDFAAHIWLVAVQGRLGMLDPQRQQQRLRELLQQPYPQESEADVRAALWALGALREHKRLTMLEEQVLTRFPHWELAREILLVRLNRAAIAQEYIATAERFLRLYSSGTPGYDEAYVALVRALLQYDRPDSVAALFRRFPTVPVEAYAELANYWLERRQPEKAAPWVQHMRATYEHQRLARLHRRPKHLSTAEWERSTRILSGLVLATEARLLRQNRRVEEAIERFQQARSAYQDDAPTELFEQLVEALRVVGQNKNAFAVCTEAILQSKDSDTLWAQFRELFLQVVRADSLELQQEMLRLHERAAELRRQRLWWQERLEWQLPETLANYPLISPAGDTLTLAQLRGKVVLLDLWASWCRPCMQSFPLLQKLWELYRERPDVAIVALNVWERTEERRKALADFRLNNPQYSFLLYADEHDGIPPRLGVTGIPTQFFLDRHGVIQFRRIGYRSEKDFLEMQDRLEVLLQHR